MALIAVVHVFMSNVGKIYKYSTFLPIAKDSPVNTEHPHHVQSKISELCGS